MGNSRDKKLYNKTKYTITGWFNIHYKRMTQRQRTKFGIDLQFDRWDFEQWILKYNYNIFFKLFKDWIDSDYCSDLVPSVDRIDCFKPYSFDNMQIITWEENQIKYRDIERDKYKLNKYRLNNCKQMCEKTLRKY